MKIIEKNNFQFLSVSKKLVMALTAYTLHPKTKHTKNYIVILKTSSQKYTSKNLCVLILQCSYYKKRLPSQITKLFLDSSNQKC